MYTLAFSLGDLKNKSTRTKQITCSFNNPFAYTSRDAATLWSRRTTATSCSFRRREA